MIGLNYLPYLGSNLYLFVYRMSNCKGRDGHSLKWDFSTANLLFDFSFMACSAQFAA